MSVVKGQFGTYTIYSQSINQILKGDMFLLKTMITTTTIKSTTTIILALRKKM
jgi:hypothetical protein